MPCCNESKIGGSQFLDHFAVGVIVVLVLTSTVPINIPTAVVVIAATVAAAAAVAVVGVGSVVATTVANFRGRARWTRRCPC